MSSEPLIPVHGGYRHLKSFQVAQLAYDVTVRFCDRYINRRSRTHDQMVQAACSGVQNIAEGSQAAGTSKKMELKLKNLPVPLPALGLQSRFATIVESTEREKARLHTHQAELDTLSASLQQRAFKGEL